MTVWWRHYVGKVQDLLNMPFTVFHNLLDSPTKPDHSKLFLSLLKLNHKTPINVDMSDPRTPVLTSNAPKPLPGIYSQAIIANGFVYCSGSVPMDPVSMKIIDGDIQAHTVSYTLFIPNQ